MRWIGVTALALLAPQNAAADVFRGPLLPPAASPPPASYWLVGVATEGQTRRGVVPRDYLFGLSVVRHTPTLSPHFSLMAAPEPSRFRNVRVLAGFGLRSYFQITTAVEVSVGTAFHFEYTAADHFWLAYATPVELGVTVYRRRGWEIGLFGGARKPLAGALIESFLLDPNGYDSDAAREDLESVRTDRPWRGFLRIAFTRRLD